MEATDNFVPRHSLTKQEYAARSASLQAFYNRNPAQFMREWNEGTRQERARSMAIFRLQESLGPEFKPLANAMQADGRYTAEDLAKIAGTQISARMGNWHGGINNQAQHPTGKVPRWANTTNN